MKGAESGACFFSFRFSILGGIALTDVNLRNLSMEDLDLDFGLYRPCLPVLRNVETAQGTGSGPLSRMG